MLRAVLPLISILAMSFQLENNYRISAEFTTKESAIDGKSVLQMGNVYYDIHFHKLVFDVNFPKKTTYISTDSTLSAVVDQKLISHTKTPPLASQSIFHMALSGNLKNFGLSKPMFDLDKVEHEKDMTISTWIIKGANSKKKQSGKIITSVKNNVLFGVVILNEDDVIVSKQFFEEYTQINGFEFPSKILTIEYRDGKEHYKQMTFRNIRINDHTNESMYNYRLPTSAN